MKSTNGLSRRRILAIVVILLLAISLLVYGLIEHETANTQPLLMLRNQPHSGIISYPAEYEWPMFLHDPQHTGQLVMPGPHDAHVLVSKTFSGPIRSGAATGQGVLYFSAGNTLYATNSSTLQTMWSYQTSGPVYSAPAAGDGLVFVTSTDGTISAFNASNTHRVWSYQTGSPIYSSPILDNGLVFVGSNNGKLYAFHDLTGVQASGYPFSSSSPIQTSPAVGNSIVAFGSNDGMMYFLNETTGSEIGSFNSSGPIESSPVLWNNMVFFGSNDTNIYGLSLPSDVVAWKLKTGGPVVASPVVSENGIVFVGSTDGNVYAVNGTSGSLLWKTATGSVVSSGALANAVGPNCCGGRQVLLSQEYYLSMLYISSETGIVYGIRVDNGAVFWSYSVQGTTSASPIIAYTKLYIGSDSGVITELGALIESASVGTFDISGNSQNSFAAGQPFVLAALAAWGVYGVNETALLNIYNSNGTQILQYGKMAFVANETQYNFYYNYNGTRIPGSYAFIVVIEDAHPKYLSKNPRCCGYVNYTGQFTIG